MKRMWTSAPTTSSDCNTSPHAHCRSRPERRSRNPEDASWRMSNRIYAARRTWTRHPARRRLAATHSSREPGAESQRATSRGACSYGCGIHESSGPLPTPSCYQCWIAHCKFRISPSLLNFLAIARERRLSAPPRLRQTRKYFERGGSRMPPMTRSRSCAQQAIEKLRVRGGRRCRTPNAGENMELWSWSGLAEPASVLG